MGIIVDRVSEILDITREQIEDAASLGANVDTNFILGRGKIDGAVRILLDIDRILAISETVNVVGAAQTDGRGKNKDA